jgi:hypothetical protein
MLSEEFEEFKEFKEFEEFEEFEEFRSSGVQEFNGRLGERSDRIANKNDRLVGFTVRRLRFVAIGQTMNGELFGHGVETPRS